MVEYTFPFQGMMVKFHNQRGNGGFIRALLIKNVMDNGTCSSMSLSLYYKSVRRDFAH